jgi:hypothetical protein
LKATRKGSFFFIFGDYANKKSILNEEEKTTVKINFAKGTKVTFAYLFCYSFAQTL